MSLTVYHESEAHCQWKWGAKDMVCESTTLMDKFNVYYIHRDENGKNSSASGMMEKEEAAEKKAKK